MQTKICSKCKKEKLLNCFYKRKDRKTGYMSSCIECRKKIVNQWKTKNKDHIKEYKKETYRKYVKEYPEECKKKNHEYYKKNKEKILERNKQWKQDNYEKYLKSLKEYRDNNKEKIKTNREKYKEKKRQRDKIQQKKMRETNPIYKLKVQIRNRINCSIVRKGYKKNSKTEQILGCDYEIFIQHLLNTYKNNYGVEWDKTEKVHIDHIIPLSTANTEKEVIKLNHYTNLQLLKAKDNLHKSNKLHWNLKEDN